MKKENVIICIKFRAKCNMQHLNGYFGGSNKAHVFELHYKLQFGLFFLSQIISLPHFALHFQNCCTRRAKRFFHSTPTLGSINGVKRTWSGIIRFEIFYQKEQIDQKQFCVVFTSNSTSFVLGSFDNSASGYRIIQPSLSWSTTFDIDHFDDFASSDFHSDSNQRKSGQ